MSKMNELNLLLKQQKTLKRTDKLENSRRPQEAAYFEKEEYSSSSSFVIPRKNTLENSVLEDRCEELKMELASVQVEESLALEQHNKLMESYCIQETVIDHLLNQIDCVILETKSANRLCTHLNHYSVKEQCIDDKISTSLKLSIENPDLSSLNRFKTKLLTIASDNNGAIKKLYNEFDERQSNYKLALKNFKIILEILNANEDSLGKLKRQFDEVLMDYQHCRCILGHELPFLLAERTKLLGDCLISLGAEYDMLADRRRVLGNLFKDIGRKVQENEYILVKKETLSPRSCDNE